jgi:hypothetical protein
MLLFATWLLKLLLMNKLSSPPLKSITTGMIGLLPETLTILFTKILSLGCDPSTALNQIPELDNTPEVVMELPLTRLLELALITTPLLL